jgi:hypothetical protein
MQGYNLAGARLPAGSPRDLCFLFLRLFNARLQTFGKARSPMGVARDMFVIYFTHGMLSQRPRLA